MDPLAIETPHISFCWLALVNKQLQAFAQINYEVITHQLAKGHNYGQLFML